MSKTTFFVLLIMSLVFSIHGSVNAQGTLNIRDIDPNIVASLSPNPADTNITITIENSSNLSARVEDIECAPPFGGDAVVRSWYKQVATKTTPPNTVNVISGPFSGQTIPVSINSGRVGTGCNDTGSLSFFSGSKTFNTSSLAEGSYLVLLQVTDDRGRTARKSLSFNVDRGGSGGTPPPPPPPPPSGSHNLTITKEGTGSGTVTSNPSGISCGSDCSQSYSEGTVVNLTATPASGSTFEGWSGVQDCLDGRVTMNFSKTCTATFNASGGTPPSPPSPPSPPPPPPGPTVCTISVNSNTPTTWLIGGPNPNGDFIHSPDWASLQSSAVHTTDDDGNPLPVNGTYNILFPKNVNGWTDGRVTPASSQWCGATGSISYTLTYTPPAVPPPPDPTLVIAPVSNDVTVGGTAIFNAFYDPDGPSGPLPETRVSNLATWASERPTIASFAGAWSGQARFTGLRIGTTGITATYQGITAGATLNVIADTSPDFACSVNPSSRTVAQGNSTTYTVTAGAINSFSGNVAFSSRNLPAGASTSFSPTSATLPPSPKNSTLTFTAGASTPPGAYTFFVRCSSGSTIHEYPVNVVVVSATRFSCSGTSCIADPSGPYTTSNCNNACGAPPPPETHFECVSNACTQVSGPGPDRCNVSADCGGGGGGGGPFHGVCDVAQNACVNVAGPGVSTCSSDPACGDPSGESHLECQSGVWVIVGGPGPSQPGAVIGQSCAPATDPACDTFEALPGVIFEGSSSVLNWSCTDVSSCSITANGNTVANGGRSGNTTVNPQETTTYRISCDSGVATAETTLRVLKLEETPPR